MLGASYWINHPVSSIVLMDMDGPAASTSLGEKKSFYSIESGSWWKIAKS
jgi:hypothetical protein